MPTPSPFWDIYEEHLDEATFLWGQRDNALVSARHVLADAAGLEERLIAHLDGLVLGGAPVAKRLLLPALAADDATRVSASALALIEAERDDAVGAVLSALEGEESVRIGILRALEVTERRELPALLLPLLESPNPDVRAGVLDVFTFRSMEPGQALTGLLQDGDRRVRRAAIRATRISATSLDRDTLRRALEEAAAEVQDEALETGVVLGFKAAWAACVMSLQNPSASSERAMALVGMGGEARELEMLQERLSDVGTRGTALWALGLSGRIAAANACLPYLGDGNKGVARLAAEAFCAITGLVLEDDYLTESEPEPDGLTPIEEENLDASLVPTPEEALPLANPERVEKWWRRAQKGFAQDGRYLYGKPFEATWFLEVLARAPTRRRHALLLELAVRTRGQLWLESRDTVARQLRRIEKFAGHRGVRFLLPFKNLLTIT
ncbi:TIGR02270 family protein [Cystobacter fuscus]|uniref:TIGR02270 family protein n=1 Tax=Cystobacter fuscus TaxID=43 RepID=UPI002B2C353C|nr:TIGR02270 family protein [Cystobacter fuscus]